MKSRTFTIYLLNKDTSPQDALCKKDGLDLITDAKQTPKDAILYLMRNNIHPPWWKDFLGLSQEVRQAYPGGILFVPVDTRWFAITFGQSYHYLSASAYEYDFGLKATLNAIDKKSLRSTDVVNPETAKRERIQAPKDSDLSFFAFDGDSSAILKRISGRTHTRYKNLFTCATGGDSIRVTTTRNAKAFTPFLKKVLLLYSKDDAEKNFPEVFNIRPEKSSSVLDKLDNALLNAVKKKDGSLILSYPDIINFQNLGQVKFGSLKQPVDSFSIEAFWTCIPGPNLTALTIEDLKKSYNVRLLDGDGQPLNKVSPPLYKCLVYEHAVDGKLYHFCEGKWYCINQNFVSALKSRLDPFFHKSTLPNNKSKREADYNKGVAKEHGRTVLFDQEFFFPKGQSQIELCDLCQLGVDDTVSLIHVKAGVYSSRLSHLFSQGYVGSQMLLLHNSGAIEHFEKIVSASKLDKKSKNTIIDRVRKKNFNVVFGIITTKSADSKSDALPLFSRINLRRTIDALEAMNIQTSVQLIATMTADGGENDEG